MFILVIAGAKCRMELENSVRPFIWMCKVSLGEGNVMLCTFQQKPNIHQHQTFSFYLAFAFMSRYLYHLPPVGAEVYNKIAGLVRIPLGGVSGYIKLTLMSHQTGP